MANRLAFQTQLASIMEVLANAAVAEICKLVDDDYAVINLQMSQCQRENKALKRKLHLLELRMARGYAERRIRENSLNRSSRVHVNAALSEKYSANAADVFQNQGELYRRQLNEQVWREGESSGADVVIDPVIKDDVTGPGDSSQTGPTGVLVKAETGDENHAQQQLFIREDGVTEAVCEAAEAGYGAPPVDKADAQHSRTRHQALEPENTESDDPDVLFIKEEHSEQERKANQTHAGPSLQDGFVESSTDICGGSVSSSPTQITVALGAEESDGLDSSLMKGDGIEEEQTSISRQSPEVQITIQSVVRSQRQSWDVPSSASHLQGAAESSNVPSQIPQRRKRATSVEVTNANPYDQPPAFPRWASSSPSASQPSCSYIVDEDDCVLVQPAPLPARGPQKDPDGGTGNRVWDAGVDAEWSQVQPQQFSHFSNTEGTQLNRLNVAQSFPKISMNAQALANLTHPGVSLAGLQLPKRMLKGKRKSYICRYCGKAFTGQSNLEAHQRIHTGEKPFKCETCGKLFTEAGNLKKHQRVHTGEKPFMCNRCGKRFAWICNLRTHQQSASCGGV